MKGRSNDYDDEKVDDVGDCDGNVDDGDQDDNAGGDYHDDDCGYDK